MVSTADSTLLRNRAAVNGLSMSYLEWPGPNLAGKCTVVLLHGILQAAEGMSGLAEHLVRYHRVIVPDLRGRGETDQPVDGYEPATMAGDVAALVQHLGLERLVVIGRNHGGVIGYHLTAENPGLVHALILGDTNPEISEQRAAHRRQIIATIPSSFDSMDHAMRFYREGLGGSEERARNDIPHDLVQEGDRLVWRHNLEVIARIEDASAPRADWNVLERVRTPTLVLRGQRGRIPPDTATRMVQTIGRCEVQTIFGANHDVFIGPGAEQAFGAVDLYLIRLNQE